MSELKFYVISCSADAENIDARSLYVWGEIEGTKSLCQSAKEAKKLIHICQKKTNCFVCDAQIHKGRINRLENIKPQI